MRVWTDIKVVISSLWTWGPDGRRAHGPWYSFRAQREVQIHRRQQGIPQNVGPTARWTKVWTNWKNVKKAGIQSRRDWAWLQRVLFIQE